jgi:hypothetical protein
LSVATIPRPPSIDDNVDGLRKSPHNTTAFGFGDNLVKNVCILGKFSSEYTSLIDAIRIFATLLPPPLLLLYRTVVEEFFLL